MNFGGRGLGGFGEDGLYGGASFGIAPAIGSFEEGSDSFPIRATIGIQAEYSDYIEEIYGLALGLNLGVTIPF